MVEVVEEAKEMEMAGVVQVEVVVKEAMGHWEVNFTVSSV